MSFKTKITAFSLTNYRLVAFVVAFAAVAVGLVAALPSFVPAAGKYLNEVRVDTDPENMLSADEPVRLFHNSMKKELALHDMVVVGVVNDQNPNGVFNPETLSNIYKLTNYAKTLQWDEDGRSAGVVEADIIAPSTVDNIEQGGLGTVRFEWLMASPPTTEQEALAVRDKAQKIPFLNGTLVSDDGKALCIYLPLTDKHLSYRVYSALSKKAAEIATTEQYHITGLPVAEDTFGVEMFIQMAVSAPAAMLVIFIIMFIFFRKISVIVAPMIVALVSVIITMGALIIAGYPVHIMSSMIPIFIMPIAVLDSIHIVSEFFELYQQTKDRRKTMMAVMDDLFVPMLYTSLTSAAGFGSLALTPIPPVQVFGIFVALGIMVAWVLTIIFVPAYVMFISPKTLEKFGAVHIDGEKHEAGPMSRFLRAIGTGSSTHAKPILAFTMLVIAVGAYGISKININDNPVKWFVKSHPIRVADNVLNSHFGGTYMGYLALEAQPLSSAAVSAEAARLADEKIAGYKNEDWPKAVSVFEQLKAYCADITADDSAGYIAQVSAFVEDNLAKAEGEYAYAWEEARAYADSLARLSDVFKTPEALEYMASLQEALAQTGIVGKSNSLADIVKTVHRELYEGDAAHFTVPDSANAVAQCLLTYQSSHRANDLWHFTTPDYRKSSIWVQLKSGDNKDMSAVVDAMDKYIASHPAPAGIKAEWFGLTYINVIWQQKMVKGMIEAFGGSFLIVFIMMAVLFRSVLWGLLSMIPLTITIGAIYGCVGLAGKDYDMPVAVLSSMTLGLAVDFAIHFLARTRALYSSYGSWREAAGAVFAEPAIAITRNIVVIAVGFLPLLLAPLTPYKTVGVLLATILFVSGAATLLLLPALITVLERFLFKGKKEKTE